MCCHSPDQQEAGEESDGDEVEHCGEDGLHWWDDEAAMNHKLTQRGWTFVTDDKHNTVPINTCACVSLQSASGRSQFPALQCGTIFHLTSHQCRHWRFSDNASSRSCSLSLIRTFIPDSHSLLLSLHLCGPCNNWHYLGHTKNCDDDDDESIKRSWWFRYLKRPLKQGY